MQVTTDGSTPLSGVVAVSVGSYHFVAVKTDGTVWAWGQNTAKQLGDGTTTLQNYPIQVKTDASNYLTNVVAVESGYQHTVALTSDGKVFSWGLNDNGESGGATGYAVEMIASNAVKIAAGHRWSSALLSDGTIKSWGNNTDGQMGNSATASIVSTPVSASHLIPNAKAFSIGYKFSVVIAEDNYLLSAGANTNGEQGDETNVSSNFFDYTQSLLQLEPYEAPVPKLTLKAHGEAAGAAGEAAQAEIIEKIEAEVTEEVTATEETPAVEEATNTTTTPVATPTTQVSDIASTVFDTGVTVNTTGLTQVSSYSDSYLDYGYWNDSSSNPVHTYLSGVVTSSDFVDQRIQTGGTATYNGGLSAIVTDAQSIKSTASGTANLTLDFDTQTFTGTIDVNSAAFKADVAGSVSKYGFNASSITKNVGSSADVTGGSMSGNFYGSSAEAVGGNFGLSSSDAGSVSGTFGLKK